MEINKGEQQPKTAGSDEAAVASKLYLIATIINNITKQDIWFIVASLTVLTAVLLLIKAAFLEAAQQQIAPGQTTFANKLKIIGSIFSLSAAVILLGALIIESALREQGVVVNVSGGAAGIGAFL